MFKIYNLKMDDFTNDLSYGEYIYIITSEVSDVVKENQEEGIFLRPFTMEDFQELAEYIRFCLVHHDFHLVKEPTHYTREKFEKSEFVKEYNRHLNDLKPKSKEGLQLLKEEDILECYSLYANWWHVFYNSIFLIAKTIYGYLAFDYSFTA